MVVREQSRSTVTSKRCNIDVPDCRYRLWSIRDSLILYQLTHYREARAQRLPSGWAQLFRANERERTSGTLEGRSPTRRASLP